MAPRKPPPLALVKPIDGDEDDEGNLQLSSPSTPFSPLSFALTLVPDSTDSTSSDTTSSDDISKDLAVLERLRKSVQKNLRLRPIKSNSNLKSASSSNPWRPQAQDSFPSPASSTGSMYYTPISPPFSARHRSPSPPPRPTRALDPSALCDLLSPSRHRRPLLIDTRPPASYLASHLRKSINIAIPSLILKRYRKAGQHGGFQSLDALRQFITTEQGKARWDALMLRPGGNGESVWNGSVVVYDEEMVERERDNPQITAWALIPLIAPLLQEGGTADYLKNGLSSARIHPRLRALIVSDEPDSSDDTSDEPGKKTVGLFQLNTEAASRSKLMPEIERERPVLVNSPLPMMPAAMSSGSSASETIAFDSTPSPPPSQLAFRRPPPPKPNLRRIDTKSAERLNTNLPKLQIRTPPIRAATLSVPPSLYISTNSSSSSLQPPHSPSHLNLMYSTHSPTYSPNASRFPHIPPPSPSPGYNGQSSFCDLPPPPPSFSSSRASSPRTPITPMPRSPVTARPDYDALNSANAPPTTEDAFPAFTISAILPNFLYLGPELTTPEHVQELKTLGVKRIVNIAAECDDDHGLQLRETFDRYFHIPMRDTVEENNITKGVREACDILDDARLHSAPTYVHCKAGKSRSVTAVIAYLIHANHWTLSRAYAFVLERRRGISPNIGFVSELMTFEEQELGGKSVGVVQHSPGAHDDEHHHDHDQHNGYAPGPRRAAHARESLPPAFTTTQNTEAFAPGSMSAGGMISAARVGDSGQEMEIRDAAGRYRHARRAPVDETTLQPLRRVSKAGLESSGA